MTDTNGTSLMMSEKFNSENSQDVADALKAIEQDEVQKYIDTDVFTNDPEFQQRCATSFALGVAQSIIASRNRTIADLQKRVDQYDTDILGRAYGRDTRVDFNDISDGATWSPTIDS